MVIITTTVSVFAAVDPSAYRETMVSRLEKKDLKGEVFSWEAKFGIEAYIEGHYAFNDKKWLDEAVKYYDWLISKMEKEPDGYMGWLGPLPKDKSGVFGSDVVGDGNLIDQMLKFSEIVLKDPALKSVYGKKAEEYVNLAKKTLIDKWDDKKCWYVDGRFGVYLNPSMWVDKTDPAKWIIKEELKESDNLNKHARMGTAFLKLYRLTKDPVYKERAEKIFGHYKSIMNYYKDENRYVWNFWEPFGPFDVVTVDGKAQPRKWVAVHPTSKHYQNLETKMIVEAYHTGVVFTEEDMKRILNTNLWMWNKSFDDPQFKSADGSTNAGALWDALVDFDDTIRKLYAKEFELKGKLKEKDEMSLAYFKNVVMKEPPGFKRKYVEGDVKLPDITVYPSKEISMAVAIPAHISLSKNEKTAIMCKINKGVNGDLKVGLYSGDGKTLVAGLMEEKVSIAGKQDKSGGKAKEKKKDNEEKKGKKEKKENKKGSKDKDSGYFPAIKIDSSVFASFEMAAADDENAGGSDDEDSAAELTKQARTDEAQIFSIKWDGKDKAGKFVPAGNYLIRWNINDSQKEVQITVEK